MLNGHMQEGEEDETRLMHLHSETIKKHLGVTEVTAAVSSYSYSQKSHPLVTFSDSTEFVVYFFR